VPGYGPHQSTWWSTIDMGDSWYTWDLFRGLASELNALGMEIYVWHHARYFRYLTVYKNQPRSLISAQGRRLFQPGEHHHIHRDGAVAVAVAGVEDVDIKPSPVRFLFRFCSSETDVLGRLATKLQQMATPVWGRGTRETTLCLVLGPRFRVNDLYGLCSCPRWWWWWRHANFMQ